MSPFLGSICGAGSLDRLDGLLGPVNKLLLVLLDAEGLHLNAGSGSLGNSSRRHLLLESFFLHLTAKFDALTPEEISSLCVLTKLSAERPYLTIQPAIRVLVTLKATDVAMELPHSVQHRANDPDNLSLFLRRARNELLRLVRLPLLSIDDFFDRVDVRRFVVDLLGDDVEVRLVSSGGLESFLDAFHTANGSPEGAKVECFRSI